MQEDSVRHAAWNDAEALVDDAEQASGGLPLPTIPTPGKIPFPVVDVPPERKDGDDDEEEDEGGDQHEPDGPIQRRVLPVIAQVREATAAEQDQRARLAKVVTRDRAAAQAVETKRAAGKAEKPVKAETSRKAEKATPIAKVQNPAPAPAPVDPFNGYVETRENLDRHMAADGSAGVPFMDVKFGMCAFPLWKGNERFEDKRVCGCKVRTGKSWCPTHYGVVFEPYRRR